MQVSLRLIDMAITQHLAAKGRATMPNLAPVPKDWMADPTPQEIFEEKLHLWLEAADQLANKPSSPQIWAFAMRPWLTSILGDTACEMDIAEKDIAVIAERLSKYWESRR